MYIHQNPIREKIVEYMNDWEFSSYKEYIGLRNGDLPKIDIILKNFNNNQNFESYNETLLSDKAISDIEQILS